MNVCNISPSRMDELKRPTDDDVTLQMLVNTIRQGWPTKLHSLPPAMWPFHPYRQELITDDGLVWKGHRVIIPETLRLEYMQTVHGVILEPNLPNNMHVAFNFWPTMTKDIDTYITSSATYNSTKPHQQKEPLQLHAVSSLPWSTVAADIFEWNSHQFLVLVDSYSGWYEIDQLQNLTLSCVIQKLKRHFFCSWITSHPHHRQWETVREQWI